MVTINTVLDDLPHMDALPASYQALVRTSLTSDNDHDAKILDVFLDTNPILKPLALLLAMRYFKPYEVQS